MAYRGLGLRVVTHLSRPHSMMNKIASLSRKASPAKDSRNKHKFDSFFILEFV